MELAKIGCFKRESPSTDVARGHRSILTVALALLAYTALSFIATYPAWQDPLNTIPGDIGDPLLNTWIIAWDLHTLPRGWGALFDANIFFPLKNTLAYSEHLLGTALLVWPAYMFSGEPLLAYNVAFFLSFVLSGLGMYLLALRWTGNGWAAFLAGLAFSLAPYRFASLSHLHMLTVQWLPLAVLLLDRYLADARWPNLALFAFFLWLQAMASWHLGVFTICVAVLYIVFYGAMKEVSRRQALSLVVTFLLLALALLPVTLPYLQARELFEQRPPGVGLAYSASLADYLAASPDNRLYGEITSPLRSQPDFNVERQLFLGTTTLFLAFLSLFLVRPQPYWMNRRLVAFLWLLALVAVSLTLGPRVTIGDILLPTPYGIVQSILPHTSLLRVPARWATVVIFALVSLSAFGASWILTGASTQWGKTAAAAIAVILGCGLVADGWTVPIPTARPGSLQELPQVYHWLASSPDDFAVVEIPLYAWPLPQYEEGRRMYASTLHWKRLVNGNSGITPVDYARLEGALRGFPSLEAIGVIEELGRGGVRYAIVHPFDVGFDTDRWEKVGKRQAARSGTLFLRYADRSHYVYEINPYGARLFTDQQSLADPRWQVLARQRVGAKFGGKITLLGFDTTENDGNLSLHLYWSAEQPVPEDFTVFVHLLDEQGRIIAQADSQPDQAHYPTSAWRPGEVVRDTHVISLSQAVGGTHFSVGLYLLSTMERLPVTGQVVHQMNGIMLPR